VAKYIARLTNDRVKGNLRLNEFTKLSNGLSRTIFGNGDMGPA